MPWFQPSSSDRFSLRDLEAQSPLVDTAALFVRPEVRSWASRASAGCPTRRCCGSRIFLSLAEARFRS